MINLYNKLFLQKHLFNDDSKIKKAIEVNRFANPKIDIDKEVFNIISATEVLKLLDVGCGNGDLLIRFRKEFGFIGELHGIDLSEGILNAAINENKKSKLGIAFRVDDAQTLDYPDDSFDAIVSKNVLYYVPDIQKAVDECHRCLKDGGLFISIIYSKNNQPKLVKLREEVARKLGSKEVLNPQDRLSAETFNKYLENFSKVEARNMQNEIRIGFPKPYIEYFDCMRPHFDPIPNDEQWDQVLNSVKHIIEREIVQKGNFTDKNAFTIFIAKK